MLFIRLGGQCQVEINGLSVGPAPNDSVMVLLCGLAFRGETWSSRKEVARKLYPDSDHERRSNALRQCLYRLRQWLGEQWLELDGERIRLASGSWTLDLRLQDGTEPNAASIAPGLCHPWIDEIRLKACPLTAEEKVPMMRGFSESVRQMALYDVHAARGLLVSAANLADHFSLDDLVQISGAVNPENRLDPYATEFYAMKAGVAYKNCCFGEAVRLANLSLRCRPNRKTAISMATMLYFAAIERGDQPRLLEARRMLDELHGDNLNAITMCQFWNSGEQDEAVASRNRMVAEMHRRSRSERIQFWLNAAYFSADVGDTGACQEAITEAALLVNERSDLASQTLFHNCRAKLFLLKKEADAAQRAILEAKDAARRFGRVIQQIYVLETQSEVTAALGNFEQAKVEWSAFVRRRKSVGIGITNRLKKQQERVLV